MPTLHLIDAARIVHETRRRFFAESKRREVTASWGDLPQDQRDKESSLVQMIVDGEFERHEDVDRLRFAVVNALRPFLEE